MASGQRRRNGKITQGARVL